MLEIPRFFGLKLKTNVTDVPDGFSLDCKNVYQNSFGVMSKRAGNSIMFSSDETSTTEIDEVGSGKINGTKYWFKFSGGKFHYATTIDGAISTISPSPAISTSNKIWWVIRDNKLFFVDGSADLRYFDGSTISTSSILSRPTVALTTASVGTGFDYTYTVDNGLGESPAMTAPLTNKVSAATVRVTGNYGPSTLVAGQVVRIYSKATTVAAANKLVATYTWQAADVAATFSDIATVAIADTQTQLYTELGVAVNKSAPTALVGIIEHYGRLVAWKATSVYNSKSTNPHSWPDDSARREAFVYGFGAGDGENIGRCISFKESLYVMKKTKLAIFGGVGPDDTGNNAYSFRRLETNGLGLVGTKSVVVIGEKTDQYLVWLSQQGFVATQGDSIALVGEDVQPSLLGLSESILESAVACQHKTQGFYICFLGASGSKTGWVFDVRKDSGSLVGWFKLGEVNAKCVFWDETRYIFGTPNGWAGAERIAGSAVDYSDVQVEYVAFGAVDTTANTITVANSYATRDTVQIRTNTTIPAGLTANTTYYVIRISATVIKLAATDADAQAGTAIDITTQGAGTHSIIAAVAISGYYTTNWLKFGSATKIKKLSKPGIILNASASSVSVAVTTAYDWVNVFGDSRTITIGAIEGWGAQPYGSTPWGVGAVGTPKNVGISRRKCRAIRYKFANATLNQDFNLQGLEQDFELLRNRGNYAA